MLESKKPALRLVSLNSGAGLGIEHHFIPMFLMNKNNNICILPTHFYQQMAIQVDLNQ